MVSCIFPCTSHVSHRVRKATSDVIEQANFALDVKRRVLPIYEKVFNIEYPLPKLDTLVASDYNSGQLLEGS